MARRDGRVSWIAVPAMTICIAVLGALVWLAVPGLPGAIDFIGSTLRAAPAPTSDDDPVTATAAPVSDCRSLYPDRLWTELTWTPDVLLRPSADPPSASPALVTALAPRVRITCSWRVGEQRSIRSTVADVDAGAAAIAQATLTAEGFACAAEDGGVHCERAADGVTEVNDLADGVWLSSTLTRWEPEDYAAQTAARAFVR